MPLPSLFLRPTTPADRPFCQQLFTHVKAAELGLGEAERAQLAPLLDLQFAAHERHFQQVPLTLIDHLVVLEGSPTAIPIGRQIVWRDTQTLHLADIALLPTHRQQGYGRTLLHMLQQQAQAEQLAITLRCAPANPALRLYQRCGWQVIDATDPVQLLLRWSGN